MGVRSHWRDDGAHPLLARANLYRLRGRWEEATDTCLGILRVQPENAGAHAVLADVCLARGRTEAAARWIRMALDLAPDEPTRVRLEALERRIKTSGVSDRTAGARPGTEHTPVGGTTKLMGLSPRRWLSAMSITAVAFAALVVLALIVLQAGRTSGTLETIAGGAGTPAAPAAAPATAGGDKPAGQGLPADLRAPAEPGADARGHAAASHTGNRAGSVQIPDIDTAGGPDTAGGDVRASSAPAPVVK